MSKLSIAKYLLLPLLLSALNTWADTAVSVSGELRKWHSLALTFDGPEASEADEDNPFVNYRLNVEFVHGKTGKRYLVPGFFAADGNAENTGATKGDKWRVNFRADELGLWHWQASFRKGAFVAVSEHTSPGFSGEFMDRQKGSFSVKKSNKKYPDFRERGRLEYINEPYLRFAETGEYFIKAGPDAPENVLAYADFDGTFHNDGHKDEFVKTWEAHVSDWKKGDPSWKSGKGKALIGAVNYLSSKGMNAMSFLTMNIMGDDQNVFPYVDYAVYDRMDVSKLAQWNVVFEHAQNKGLFLHFKTQEVENQGLLDNGGVGLQRKLYYRELIARFGHHLALNWNMGEESGEWHPWNITPPQTTSQRLAMARYFHLHDPYHHHLVIHNGKSFDDITGEDSFYTGASLQTHRADFGAVHGEVKKIRSWPLVNGRKLAVSADEPGDAEHSLVPDNEDPEHNMARMNGLWGALMAGAWGTEWYFGYKHPHSDLTAQDWRTRDKFWDQARYALDFFKLIDVPYQKSANLDNIVKDGSNAWALGVEGEFYIVYVKDASKEVELNFPLGVAEYSVVWFNPRSGGKLQRGTKEGVQVNKKSAQFWERSRQAMGFPQEEASKDWVALVKRI